MLKVPQEFTDLLPKLLDPTDILLKALDPTDNFLKVTRHLLYTLESVFLSMLCRSAWAR